MTNVKQKGSWSRVRVNTYLFKDFAVIGLKFPINATLAATCHLWYTVIKV